MTRRLFVALLVVLALGAVLDGTVYRNWAGQPTIMQRSDVPTLVGRAADRGFPIGRYSIYLAVREAAPGADILIDIQARDVDPTFLSALGAAGVVQRVNLRNDISRMVEVANSREPTVSGSYRRGPWQLHVQEGPVERLLVGQAGGMFYIIDARLIAPPTAPSTAETTTSRTTFVRPPDDPPGLFTSIFLEAGVLFSLLLAGGFLLPIESFPRPMRISMAFVIGLSTVGGLGLLFLPGLWGYVAAVSLAVCLGAVAQRRGLRVGWARADIRALSVAAISVVAVVAWSRWTTFLYLTPDSYDYWAGAAGFADGVFRPDWAVLKRGLSQQAIHAVGFALGIEGLQALGPAVIAASGALLGAVAVESAGTVRDSSQEPGALGRSVGRTVGGILIAGLAIVPIAASPQIGTLAAYLNSHVLVAAALLVLSVLLGWVHGDKREWATPAAIALTVQVVLARAEGPLLVGLVLVGALVLPGKRVPWNGAWIGLGLGTVAWACLLSMGGPEGGPVSRAAVLLGVGGAGALAVPLLLRRVGIAHRALLVQLTLGTLWFMTLALLTLEISGGDVRFLEVISENLGRGVGGWGILGALLMIAGAIVAVALHRDTRYAPARALVSGFIPVALISRLGDDLVVADTGLGLLLSGGGRIGWGDSINRMWMHVVLVILYLIVAGARSRGVADEFPPAAPRTSQLGRVGVALAIAVATFAAVQWQPQFIPRETLASSIRVLTSTGELPLGEMTSGSVLRQTFYVPLAAIAAQEGEPRRICADVRFVTFARINAGTLQFSTTFGDQNEVIVLDSDSIEDWGVVPACVAIQSRVQENSTEAVGTFVIEIRGEGSALGSAVSALEASTVEGPARPNDIGAIVKAADESGAFTLRASRGIALDLRIEIGPPIRAIDRAALILPWAMLLLGVVAIIVDRQEHSTVG